MELEVAATMLRATAAPTQGIKSMGEEMRGVNALVPDESPWKSLCCMVEGVAHQLSGEPDAARQLLEEGARRGAVAAPAVEAALSRPAGAARARPGRRGSRRRACVPRVEAGAPLRPRRRGQRGRRLRHVGSGVGEAWPGQGRCQTRQGLDPDGGDVPRLRPVVRSRGADHAGAGAAAARRCDPRPSASRSTQRVYMRRVEDAPVLTRWLEDALELTDQVAASAPWPLTAGRAADPPSAAHPPQLQRDRRPAVRLDQYGEVARKGDLSQARRLLTHRGGRNRAGGRSHS